MMSDFRVGGSKMTSKIGRYKVKIPHTYKAIKGNLMQTSFSKKNAVENITVQLLLSSVGTLFSSSILRAVQKYRFHALSDRD